jgi:hypothetical protein
VAGYRKKRQQQIKREVAHEEIVKKIEAVGKKFSGKGKTILIVLGVIVAVGIGSFFTYRYFSRKADRARSALGAAIKIQDAQITSTPTPGSTDLTFTTEKERAEKALAAFQDVANKYGEPYHTTAVYFLAVDHPVLDRPNGLNEPTEAMKGKDATVATLSKFALAQAKEADNDLAGAAALYAELVKLNSAEIPADTANVALAGVYSKQGNKQEASNILFKIGSDSRTAKDADGKPKTPSGAARSAIEKLQKIDPDRYAQLPPEPPPANSPFGGGMPIG